MCLWGAFWNVMMSLTGCENMLGGCSTGPNENISNEHGAEGKPADRVGGMDLSVWPVITPPPLPLLCECCGTCDALWFKTGQLSIIYCSHSTMCHQTMLHQWYSGVYVFFQCLCWVLSGNSSFLWPPNPDFNPRRISSTDDRWIDI